MENPVIAGSLAFAGGTLLGSSVESLVKAVGARADLTANLGLSPNAKSILDNSISIMFQIGLLGFGIHFITNAMDWLPSHPPGFTMLIMGVTMSSPHLKDSGKALYDATFGPLVNSTVPQSEAE